MIKFYNTLTRKKENFKPIKKKKVGIYSCGPTVYSYQHIGNMYAYVQWDAMVRFLKYDGYKVKWVMNITDVGHLTSDEDTGEDKMEKGAKRENMTVWQIADKYIAQFTNSMTLLNINTPDVLCRATSHIKEQIDLIKKIEKNGFAYKTKTGLVFDTSKFKGYSKFSRLNLKNQESGARVEVDIEKKKPWDFLLWITNQPSHIMLWDSFWGKGFPGWHIECTAMSVKYLGKNFDIHTGGKEHIPVHHTNEVAQAYGAFGKQTANYWLHNDWLLIDNQKVSKSLGNTILITDILEKSFDPLSLRYLSLTSSYRQGLNFSWGALKSAQNALFELRAKLLEFKNSKDKIRKSEIKKYKDKFIKLVEDDLGFPKALGFVWQIVKDKKLNNSEKAFLILDFDYVFGLNLDKYKPIEIDIPEEVKKLVNERETARKEKNWQKSDELRNKISQMGFKVEDTPLGPILKKL